MELEDKNGMPSIQAVVDVEYTNQDNTINHVNVDFIDQIDVNEKRKQWNDIDELPLEPGGGLPVPQLPPLQQTSTPMFPDTEADSTFADDLEALFSSTDSQTDHPGDLLDVGAEAGVCGLKNLGNTCFMSTGVQCLMATPALIDCLLHQTPTTKDTLTAHLSLLTHKMWSGQYSAVQPSDFKKTLGAHYPQFKDFRQHDCQEFLALLLDGLHEQMNTSSKYNKFQNTLENNRDVEMHSKVKMNQVSYGLCKNVSQKHNNLIETNDDLKSKTVAEVESVLCPSRMDKKINNKTLVNDVSVPDNGSKMPFLLNKHSNEIICEPEFSIDEARSVHIKSKDSLPIHALNNCSSRLSDFEDIIKDAKTSNVNVLVTEHETNNEIKFDSDKFPKSENLRRKETFNYNSFHLYDNNVNSGKRGKSTVTHYKSTVDFREGLDLKRLKMQPSEQSDDENYSCSVMQCDWEKNHRLEDERRHIVTNKNLDKNYRMEYERKHRDGPGTSSMNCITENAQLEVDLEADVQWQKHLSAHQSVIVDTFQGQFRSTVTCSKCKHVSVTYEPFMYLSVPLPHAMEIQLSIIFVSAKEHEPVQYLLTVGKADTIAVVKEQLIQMIDQPILSLVLAEVLECHIAKILDENYPVRYINTRNRTLYALEVATFSCFSDTEEWSDHYKVGFETSELIAGNTCIICLEEKELNMSHHLGCTCILCDMCIVRLSEHHGVEALKCPICRKELVPGDNLVIISQTQDTSPPIRMLNVGLVFRLDTIGDGNNNTRTVQLFGHPRLLRLPNRLQNHQLLEAVASLIPYSQPYKILLVDGQGHHCSRCMFNSHCRGCPIEVEGSLILRAGDCLAATFVEVVTEISPVKHSTMLQSAVNTPLSLYDCIKAFSQSELLDEHNPWYCPNCKKNQCATKTLSVWRYPNYLIIYLKRFVFQDCVSTKLEDKVTFPLCGLKLSPTSQYDLYACVCHVGGVSAGHYTAYTQHPHTGEWHLYNDDCVTKQAPRENDCSNAYILFYKKQDADLKLEDLCADLSSVNSKHS